MGDNEQPPYDRRDDWVIANNIFHELRNNIFVVLGMLSIGILFAYL
jgi:hypothetical protein